MRWISPADDAPVLSVSLALLLLAIGAGNQLDRVGPWSRALRFGYLRSWGCHVYPDHDVVTATVPRSTFRSTKHPELRFRALLTGESAQLELTRA